MGNPTPGGGHWLVKLPGPPERVIPFERGEDVAEALAEGNLDPSDLVRHSTEPHYRPLDAHPSFRDVAESAEETGEAADEETHLDMNPLIDVSLVLLIFFILTATYATLTRRLELPNPEGGAGQAKMTPKDEALRTSLTVTVALKKDVPVVRLENRVVAIDELEAELTKLMKSSGKKDMLLDVAPGVKWETTVKLFEAGRGAEVGTIRPVARK